MVRAGTLKRPGLIVGSFACLTPSLAQRANSYREPDAQLGFLWGGATMGQLLSIPLFIAGLCFIAYALKRRGTHDPEKWVPVFG